MNIKPPCTPSVNHSTSSEQSLITRRPHDRSNTIYPMGKAAQGIIMYTPDGYMSAQLQTPGVASFDPPGTDADWADVGRKYIAYTGRFFLDEKGKR